MDYVVTKGKGNKAKKTPCYEKTVSNSSFLMIETNKLPRRFENTVRVP